MQVKNVSGRAREIANGPTVEAGEVAEVDDALGASLLEQPDNWEAVKAPKEKPVKAGKESDGS